MNFVHNKNFKRPFFYYFYYFFAIIIIFFFFFKYSFKIYQIYFPIKFQNFDNIDILKKNIKTIGGNFTIKDEQILFNEDSSLNKHYLEFQNFEKSNISIIYVNFFIETNNYTDLIISIISNDENSSIWLDLGQVNRIYNLGAKYGKFELLSKENIWQNNKGMFSLNLKNKLKISAKFKLLGTNDKFSVRIQGFRGFNTANENYIGNKKASFFISNSKINIIHFGKNINK